MTRDKIIKLAQEAGWPASVLHPHGPGVDTSEYLLVPTLERFAALVADAELQKLREENMALRQIIDDIPSIEAELSETSDRLHKVETQRNALLEALELAADFLEHSTEFRIGHPGFEQAQAKACAAIKAVEEGE